MLYSSLDEGDQTIREPNTEEALLPESAMYIDFLIKDVRKGAN